MYSLKLMRDWETHRYSYAKGLYRVPADMPDDVARIAIAKGIAVKTMPVLQMKVAHKK